MKTKMKFAAAALMTASMVALGATAASAEIACNAEGECWHIHKHYDYQPEFGVTIHPDGWHWGDADHFKWREHHGRGYWKNGVWITF